MNPLLPDDPNSKLNACVRNVLHIWEEGKEDRLTQLLFCDLSSPKGDGQFNVYDDVKKKLLAAGVPESEVAFIHTADTEQKRRSCSPKCAPGRCAFCLAVRQNGGRHQRAGPSCCRSSPGRRLETLGHDPAQRPHHPAGQSEQNGADLQLRHGRDIRRVLVSDP